MKCDVLDVKSLKVKKVGKVKVYLTFEASFTGKSCPSQVLALYYLLFTKSTLYDAACFVCFGPANVKRERLSSNGDMMPEVVQALTTGTTSF